MARAEKRDRDVKDDGLDLDDRREAKRARQANGNTTVDSTGGNGDLRSRRAEELKKLEILLASGIISATKILPLLDGAVLSKLSLDMIFIRRIKEAISFEGCMNCPSGETPHKIFDYPKTPLCCKCGNRGHQGFECNAFPDKASYLYNHGLQLEDEAAAFRHASNPPYPDSIPRPPPNAGDTKPSTSVPVPEAEPAEQTHIIPWKMIYKVNLKSHGILHKKYWEVSNPPLSGKYLNGERASNLIEPNLEFLQDMSRRPQSSTCQDWPQELKNVHNPLTLLEMMAKFDEALDNEVQISWVYSQRSIGYREQRLEVRDSFLETEAGRALLDMKAKRDTGPDLRLQAEEKIWDMKKTVRRLDSELQEVKIQLKEERDKNENKGGLTAAH